MISIKLRVVAEFFSYKRRLSFLIGFLSSINLGCKSHVVGVCATLWMCSLILTAECSGRFNVIAPLSIEVVTQCRYQLISYPDHMQITQLELWSGIWMVVQATSSPELHTDTDTEFYYTLAAISRIAE